MKGILEIAQGYGQSFPAWFHAVFWNLLAAFLVVSVLVAILKKISSPIFIDSIKTILAIAVAAIRGAVSALESPIDRPMTKLVFKGMDVIYSYITSLIFLFLFLGILAAVFVFGLPSAPKEVATLVGLLCLFLYMAIFFRSETDRSFLALKEFNIKRKEKAK